MAWAVQPHGSESRELGEGGHSSMPLRGQGLVEYGLIIALVAVLAIAGLIIFGPAISNMLSNVSGSV